MPISFRQIRGSSIQRKMDVMEQEDREELASQPQEENVTEESQNIDIDSYFVSRKFYQEQISAKDAKILELEPYVIKNAELENDNSVLKQDKNALQTELDRLKPFETEKINRERAEKEAADKKAKLEIENSPSRCPKCKSAILIDDENVLDNEPTGGFLHKKDGLKQSYQKIKYCPNCHYEKKVGRVRTRVSDKNNEWSELS